MKEHLAGLEEKIKAIINKPLKAIEIVESQFRIAGEFDCSVQKGDEFFCIYKAIDYKEWWDESIAPFPNRDYLQARTPEEHQRTLYIEYALSSYNLYDRSYKVYEPTVIIGTQLYIQRSCFGSVDLDKKKLILPDKNWLPELLSDDPLYQAYIAYEERRKSGGSPSGSGYLAGIYEDAD